MNFKSNYSDGFLTAINSTYQWGKAANEISNFMISNNDNASNDLNISSSDSEYDDYYYYDYEDSVNTLPIGELVGVGLVYGLTFLLGVVGNSLVIFSIARHRRLHSVTNSFLLSLACADLLLVIICVPIKVNPRFSQFFHNVCGVCYA